MSGGGGSWNFDWKVGRRWKVKGGRWEVKCERWKVEGGGGGGVRSDCACSCGSNMHLCWLKPPRIA